jgi:hypothetical protein
MTGFNSSAQLERHGRSWLSISVAETMRQFLSTAALLAVVMSPVLRPSGAQAAPATEEEMTLYSRIASLNACLAVSNGIEFKKAIGIAGETLTQTIQGQNGGAIAQVGGDPLPMEDLRKGSINSVLIAVAQVCPDQMPGDVRDKINEALKSEGAAAPSAE